MSERLTDEELDEAFAYAHGSLRLTAALSELKERRAADLTAEDVEALAFAKHCVNHSLIQMRMSPGGHGLMDLVKHQDALAILDKLIGGKA